MDTDLIGIVKKWNDEKGYGFIEVGEFPHDYDLFFHISSCDENYEPASGDEVFLSKCYDYDKGKYNAADVSPTGKSVKCSEYFGNRVSKRNYNEARQNSLKLERGCTCEDEGINHGRCWYCELLSYL